MEKPYNEEETMKHRFDQVVTETRDSVEEQTTIEKFVESILALGVYVSAPEERDRSLIDEHREEIKNAKTISEIFIVLSAYWNYLNYEILEYIINLHGTSEDSERLKNYNEEVDNFCKRTIFEPPEDGSRTCNLQNQIAKQVKFVVKLNIRENITYEEVLQIRRNIAKILGIKLAAFIIVCVDAGCMQLTFLIPKFVPEEIFPLSCEQTSALSKDASVIKLECGHYIFQV